MPPSQSMYKTNGKLFLFGFSTFINAKKTVKKVTYLIEYILNKNKGVHAIIFKEYHTTFTERH
jgi:hypothetical protein